MCIALLSTSHPQYPFILLSNRDEVLSRPTDTVHWWDAPNDFVLGGRDTQRAERGTWLGITKQGRIAILTNFREEGVEVSREKSRGGIPNAYLTGPPEENPDEFAARLMRDVGVNDVGGFTLLFGELRAPTSDGTRPGLSLLSNRSASAADLKHIATKEGETHGLSNSHFGDTSWPKVVQGKKLLEQAIKEHAYGEHCSPSDFIKKLFDILSVDNLRQREPGEDWDVYVRQMRNSILIPPVKGKAAPEVEVKGELEEGRNDMTTAEHARVDEGGSGAGYGTQKQTVVLVDRGGHVQFSERTLYDDRGRRIPDGEGEKSFRFQIDGWKG